MISDRTVVLASASPRRAELLSAAGFIFTVRPAGIDETIAPDADPEQAVIGLAARKAAAAADSGSIVIAADTIVVCNGQIFTKPKDAEDSRRMLAQLNGNTHKVLTGVCVIDCRTRKRITFAETTLVTFARMSDAEIDDYIATGEPDDKVGAYAIQGHAAKYITDINGSYTNVVGLPMERLSEALNGL